jgi:hypothetical protein
LPILPMMRADWASFVCQRQHSVPENQAARRLKYADTVRILSNSTLEKDMSVPDFVLVGVPRRG